MKSSDRLRTLARSLKDDRGPLFAIFLFQTLALTATNIAVERPLAHLSNWWLLSGAGLAAGGMVGLYAYRQQRLTRGTLVTLVVKPDDETWQTIEEDANAYAGNERYAYHYPYRHKEPLPKPDQDGVAHWHTARLICKGVLTTLLMSDFGAPIDERRVALILNMPLPLAFALGREWDDVCDKSKVELVAVRPPTGTRPVEHKSARPYTAWNAAKSRTPALLDTQRDANAGEFLLWLLDREPDTATGLPVGIERHGHQVRFDAENSHEITDQVVGGLARAIQHTTATNVDLYLACTVSAAFAAGYLLRGNKQKTIRVFNYDETIGYYEVQL